jgi:hypothetical protein
MRSRKIKVKNQTGLKIKQVLFLVSIIQKATFRGLGVITTLSYHHIIT